MKKSKLFGMAAMAAMMLGSCSTDEVVNDYSPENAIQFGTYVGRDAVSRAHVIEVDELAKEGFGVFAYYTDESDFANTSTPNFMYNQEVKGKSIGNTTYSTTEWEYSPLKYWPNEANDKVTFFAYAPYDKNVDGTNNAYINLSENTVAGVPAITTYLVSTNLSEQVDLLYATPIKNATKQAINGNVKFSFKHALSRIGFKVQTLIDKVNTDETGDDGAIKEDTESNQGEELDNATTITINEVKINFGSGYLSNGKLELENGAWSFDGVTPAAQTFTLTSANFNDFSTNKINSTKQQLNDDDSYIMIIPQFLNRETNSVTDANDDINIVVTYTVTTDDSNLSNPSVVQNVMTSKDFTFNFEQGKAYNFVLHLGLSSIKLTAEVEEWKDSADGKDFSVNVPLNTTNP